MLLAAADEALEKQLSSSALTAAYRRFRGFYFDFPPCLGDYEGLRESVGSNRLLIDCFSASLENVRLSSVQFYRVMLGGGGGGSSARKESEDPGKDGSGGSKSATGSSGGATSGSSGSQLQVASSKSKIKDLKRVCVFFLTFPGKMLFFCFFPKKKFFLKIKFRWLPLRVN